MNPTEQKDGGPAFPYAFQHEDDGRFISEGFCPGMSLRDWFAGQALQGLLASPGVPKQGGTVIEKGSQYAAGAYEIADAMLKARAEKGGAS